MHPLQIRSSPSERQPHSPGEIFTFWYVNVVANLLQLSGAAKGIEYLHDCRIVHGNCTSFLEFYIFLPENNIFTRK